MLGTCLTGLLEPHLLVRMSEPSLADTAVDSVSLSP